MQYVLTQQEFQALMHTEEYLQAEYRDRLQRVCTLAADHVPVRPSWMAKDVEPLPWGCILSKDSNGTGKVYGYCDECPVKGECPYDKKRWSK